MGEEPHGVPADDFCPFYAQAQSALMEHDAIERRTLSNGNETERFRINQAMGFTSTKQVFRDQEDPA